MSEIPLSVLFGTLIFLVLLSAFFSAAEIAMVSLNRHRLRSLAERGHRGARIASRLVERPDRLIGVILLGSNSINALFSALTTITVIRLWGEKESAIGIATVIITLVVLILTDLAPKTLAALHPERIAFPSAYVLRPLLKISYPIVWFINALANGLLRLAGIHVQARATETLTTEELRALVLEAGVLMPDTHQDMVLAVLELEKLTVDDVMIPRGEIDGLDLDAEWDDILAKLTTSDYTRLPVYHGSLDQVEGILHLRKTMRLLHQKELTREALMGLLITPYYVPEGTSLGAMLRNFREQRRRIALVVDEYGDILGLVTLEEILEEIVGEFTGPRHELTKDIRQEADGSYLVEGGVALRELNRRLDWQLPTDGPRTVSGLITEHLETLPEGDTSLQIGGYQFDILHTRGKTVRLVRIRLIERPATNGEQRSD